jgi:hypothetical protein
VALEANNEAYMEKMSAVRDIQGQHKALQQTLDGKMQKANPALMQTITDLKEQLKAAEAAKNADLAGELKAALAQAQKDAGDLGKAIDPALANQIDALKARAKKETAEANFFASEAYLSEGPLQHIVNGKQAKNPEVFKKLKPEHFLGSINEQFGDFMKDVSHYAGDEGQAFCQTSKYLHRLLEGITLLSTKEGFENATFAPISKEAAAAMATKIDQQLLPIRGAATAPWNEMSDEDRFESALAAAQAVYGVGSMTALAGLFRKVTANVNAVVRATLSAEGGMRPDREQMTAYMQGSR